MCFAKRELNMKNFVSSGLKSLTNLVGDFKAGRQLSEILHPLSQMAPSFALLRAHLNGDMTFDEMVVHLHAASGSQGVTLDCYDLVVLYNFCRDLVGNGKLSKGSRAEFMYFSREAGDIFYGHLRNTRTLTIFVTDKEYLDVIRSAVEDKESKMTHRNKTPFPIPTITVKLLEDHPKKYRKFKADIFGNIPFIVDTMDLDPCEGKQNV